MKSLLLSVLLLSACTESFRALSPEGPQKPRGKPSVTVTVLSPDLIPNCDSHTQGLRMWVAAEGQAKVCSSGRWKTAALGKESFGYESRSQTRYYQWEDSGTKKRWSVAKAIGTKDVARMCDKGWRLPEKHEIATASSNGLFQGIKANGGMAFQRAWIKSEHSAESVTVIPKGSSDFVEEKTAETGIYCILDS